MEPAPEEVLHRPRPQPVADPLEGDWVGAGLKPVVQRLIFDAGLLKLSLRPFVAVEVDPDRVGRERVGLPKRRALVRVPQVVVEVIDISTVISSPLPGSWRATSAAGDGLCAPQGVFAVLPLGVGFASGRGDVRRSVPGRLGGADGVSGRLADILVEQVR